MTQQYGWATNVQGTITPVGFEAPKKTGGVVRMKEGEDGFKSTKDLIVSLSPDTVAEVLDQVRNAYDSSVELSDPYQVKDKKGKITVWCDVIRAGMPLDVAYLSDEITGPPEMPKFPQQNTQTTNATPVKTDQKQKVA